MSWESRKQTSVALSTTEAEYVALSEAAKEALYFGRLLEELSESPFPLTLYCDNRGAIDLTNNPVFHRRSKHISIRYHFVRDTVSKDLIKVEHLPGSQMIADYLTKALPRATLVSCIEKAGLSPSP